MHLSFDLSFSVSLGSSEPARPLTNRTTPYTTTTINNPLSLAGSVQPPTSSQGASPQQATRPPLLRSQTYTGRQHVSKKGKSTSAIDKGSIADTALTTVKDGESLDILLCSTQRLSTTKAQASPQVASPAASVASPSWAAETSSTISDPFANSPSYLQSSLNQLRVKQLASFFEDADERSSLSPSLSPRTRLTTSVSGLGSSSLRCSRAGALGSVSSGADRRAGSEAAMSPTPVGKSSGDESDLVEVGDNISEGSEDWEEVTAEEISE